MPHISFSELKKWDFCPFYHKLVYKDKIKGFEGNTHTAFGKAVHKVCESIIINEVKEPKAVFHEEFVKEISYLKEDCVDWNLVDQMKTQGSELVELVLPAVKEEFPNWSEVISVEEQLFESIDEFSTKPYDFKGYIDLVIKTDDGKYHVIDWKTCSWGWDSRRKADPMNVYQLTLYKKYWAKKHSVCAEDVETYFALLKRTAKTNKVEFVRVSNGKKRTQNATDLLMKALYNINAGVKIKKRTSCNRCEFRRTEHCP